MQQLRRNLGGTVIARLVLLTQVNQERWKGNTRHTLSEVADPVQALRQLTRNLGGIVIARLVLLTQVNQERWNGKTRHTLAEVADRLCLVVDAGHISLPTTP